MCWSEFLSFTLLFVVIDPTGMLPICMNFLHFYMGSSVCVYAYIFTLFIGVVVREVRFSLISEQKGQSGKKAIFPKVSRHLSCTFASSCRCSVKHQFKSPRRFSNIRFIEWVLLVYASKLMQLRFTKSFLNITKWEPTWLPCSPLLLEVAVWENFSIVTSFAL